MFRFTTFRVCKNAILIIAFCSLLTPLRGQSSITVLADVGSNQVSNGGYFYPSLLFRLEQGPVIIKPAMQFSFSADESWISGFSIDAGVGFEWTSLDFESTIFLLSDPGTGLVSETDFGVRAFFGMERFEFSGGYHIRRYRLAETFLTSSVGEDKTILERRNFIYRGTWHIRDNAEKWNVSLSVTNYDHFMLQQETNPMAFISGYFDINKATRVFGEAWCRGAGMLNLSANYYGYQFRTGIIWQFATY